MQDVQRRLLDLEHDHADLLAMHRISWQINFPGQDLSELAFVQSLRSGIRRREVFVYENGCELIAWLWLDLATPQLGVHIRHLQVDRRLWGHGIGRRLAQDAIVVARQTGAPCITLNVTKANRRALKLYESLGFGPDEDYGDRQRMKLEL